MKHDELPCATFFSLYDPVLKMTTLMIMSRQQQVGNCILLVFFFFDETATMSYLLPKKVGGNPTRRLHRENTEKNTRAWRQGTEEIKEKD